MRLIAIRGRLRKRHHRQDPNAFDGESLLGRTGAFDIAGELRRRLVLQLPGDQMLELGAPSLELASGAPRARPLLVQRGLESGFVDAELLLLGDLAQKLDRQAVGVVELERRGTR